MESTNDTTEEATETPAAEEPVEKPKIRIINSTPVEPVNLLDAAGSPVAKRLIPLLGGAAVVAVVIWWAVSR